MRAACIDRNVEKENSPWLGRCRQVVGEPAILDCAGVQIVVRIQSVLNALRHKQAAEMNIPVIERIEMLRAGGGIGWEIKRLQKGGVAGVKVVVAEDEKVRR